MNSYRGHEFENGLCVRCGAREQSVRQFQSPCTKAAVSNTESEPIAKSAIQVNEKKQIATLFSEPAQVNPHAKRYTDAYLIAVSIVRTADIVKNLGIGLAVLIVLSGLIGGISQSSPLVAFGGLLLGAILIIPFYAIGIHMSAQGQMLLATLDTAVVSSPFLTREEMEAAMRIRNK